MTGGRAHEWNGAWSDYSELWAENAALAAAVGLRPDSNDGLFFMAFEDFLEQFSLVEIASFGSFGPGSEPAALTRWSP